VVVAFASARSIATLGGLGHVRLRRSRIPRSLVRGRRPPIVTDRRHDTARDDTEPAWNGSVQLSAAPCPITVVLRRSREKHRATASLKSCSRSGVVNRVVDPAIGQPVAVASSSSTRSLATGPTRRESYNRCDRAGVLAAVARPESGPPAARP